MKNLRWDDEPWIKVYTRDPAEFLALSFDASGLLLHLWRKLDKSGVFAIGDVAREEVAELLALTFRIERTRMEAALAELVRRKFVVLAMNEDQQVLVVPDFEPAQSARASDRVRQQEKRKRDRDEALSSSRSELSSGHAPSRAVTDGHAPSRAVTDGHAPSRIEENRKENKRVEDVDTSPTTSPSHAPPTELTRRSVMKPEPAEGGPKTLAAPCAFANRGDPNLAAIRQKLASMPKPLCFLAEVEAEQGFYSPVMNGAMLLDELLAAIDDAAGKLGPRLRKVQRDDDRGLEELERHVGGYINQARKTRHVLPRPSVGIRADTEEAPPPRPKPIIHRPTPTTIDLD